ncbi:MAG: DUF1629 domain-containing protein, partial [Myxococcota bacterium]
MNIYQPIGADDYECVVCCDSEDYDVFDEFDGSPRSATWRPIAVRRYPGDEGERGLPSDFPWMVSDVLVLRERAVIALRDMLDRHGELLPLDDHDGVGLVAYNVHTVDALDESRSGILRIPGSPRIMDIERPAFIESAVRGLDIFRLPYRAMPTYVSQGFVDRVASAGLVG